MLTGAIKNRRPEWGIYLFLSILILLGECLLVSGLSGEAHSEFMTLVYGLWILTFLPALALVVCCVNKKTPIAIWTFRICLVWLIFLYLSLAAVQLGKWCLDTNFIEAMGQAQAIIEKIDAFRSKHNRCPKSLEEVSSEFGPVEIPSFFSGYSKENGENFSIVLCKPDGLWFRYREYHSDTRRWQEPRD